MRVEKRSTKRVKPRSPLPVCVGPRDCVIIDFSHSGARVRHAGGLKIGSKLRLVFFFGAARFAAMAEILACRVVAIASRDAGAALFESRLRFHNVDVQIPENTVEMRSAG